MDPSPRAARRARRAVKSRGGLGPMRRSRGTRAAEPSPTCTRRPRIAWSGLMSVSTRSCAPGPGASTPPLLASAASAKRTDSDDRPRAKSPPKRVWAVTHSTCSKKSSGKAACSSTSARVPAGRSRLSGPSAPPSHLRRRRRRLGLALGERAVLSRAARLRRRLPAAARARARTPAATRRPSARRETRRPCPSAGTRSGRAVSGILNHRERRFHRERNLRREPPAGTRRPPAAAPPKLRPRRETPRRRSPRAARRPRRVGKRRRRRARGRARCARGRGDARVVPA